MMQSGGGDGSAVNWELARDTARGVVVAGGRPVGVGDRAPRGGAGARPRLACGSTPSPPSRPPARAAERGAAASGSRRPCRRGSASSSRSPVEVNESMSGMLPTGGLGEGLPPELAQMAAPLLGMARQMGSMMFGSQLGQGLGVLAGEVLGAADVGIPLTDDGRAALLPRNVAAFGEGLGVELDQVRLYLALRENGRAAPLRPRAVAALAAHRRRRGVRRGHPRRPRPHRGGRARHRPEQPRGDAGGRSPPASSCPRRRPSSSPRWPASRRCSRSSRAGSTTSSRRPARAACPAPSRCARPCDAVAPPADPPSARSRRWSVSSCGRDGCASRRSCGSRCASERGIEARDGLWEHPDLLPGPDDLDGDEAIQDFVRRSAPLDLSALEGLGDAPAGDDPADPADPVEPPA